LTRRDGDGYVKYVLLIYGRTPRLRGNLKALRISLSFVRRNNSAAASLAQSGMLNALLSLSLFLSVSLPRIYIGRSIAGDITSAIISCGSHVRDASARFAEDKRDKSN